jgi:hypothetical protein
VNQINSLSVKPLVQPFASPVVSSPLQKSVPNSVLAQTQTVNPQAFQNKVCPTPTLPTPEESQAQVQAVSSAQISSNAAKLPQPKALAQALAIISGQGPTHGVSLNQLGNKALVHTLMRCEDVQGPRFSSIRRDAAELRKSGILEDFQTLTARKIEVPESEYNRSLDDDAVLVMTDFSKMTPEQIHDLKEAAYRHPEVERDLPAAIERGYYGCDQHKQYGAIVEALTGGVISAEEAMAMNPTGGIPGPGAKEVPLIGRFDSGLRHAQRHDATGFLITRFNVGPGYGSEEGLVSLGKNNPLSGQVYGLLRESINMPSTLPDFTYVGKSGRYQQSNLA